MGSGNGTTTQNPVVVGIAIAILVAYGGVTWFLFVHVGAGTETWTRYTVLLGGIEAIAFVAAGYLFGREVHRQQAEKAEKRATDAQADAKTANATAVESQRKGRDLVEFLRGRADGQVESDFNMTNPSQKDFKEAADYAERLFPDRTGPNLAR